MDKALPPHQPCFPCLLPCLLKRQTKPSLAPLLLTSPASCACSQWTSNCPLSPAPLPVPAPSPSPSAAPCGQAGCSTWPVQRCLWTRHACGSSSSTNLVSLGRRSVAETAHACILRENLSDSTCWPPPQHCQPHGPAPHPPEQHNLVRHDFKVLLREAPGHHRADSAVRAPRLGSPV